MVVALFIVIKWVPGNCIDVVDVVCCPKKVLAEIKQVAEVATKKQGATEYISDGKKNLRLSRPFWCFDAELFKTFQDLHIL